MGRQLVNTLEAPRHRDEASDLQSFILRMWLRRWWVLGSIIASGVLATATVFLMTPVYRASTVALPATMSGSGLGALGSALGQLGGLASLAGLDVGSGDLQAEETLAVLQSREFTEKFIHERRLLPLLFPKRWDVDAGKWREGSEIPTLALGFKYFDESVRSVSRDNKTGLITLRIVWRDAQQAAQWANELVARVNAEMRVRAITKTNASMEYLQKELAATQTVETREAISRLVEAQITQRMLANVTEDYALRVVDRALPPDPRDVLRPKKLLTVALGLLAGAIVGVFGALVLDLWSPRPVGRTSQLNS